MSMFYDYLKRLAGDQKEITVCPDCGKPKQAYLDLGGEEILVPILCECEERVRSEREKAQLEALKESNRRRWMGQYYGMTFEKAQETKAIPTARKYAERFPEMLSNRVSFAFSGGTGTGKTFAAACVANEVIRQGYKAWMATSPEMIEMMFDDSETVLDRMKYFDLIVIDDLGAERGTEYAGEKLCTIIDSRAKSGLPTIVTTNIDLEGKAPNLTYERIFSRLKEMCPQFRVTGEDLRAKEGKSKREVLIEQLRT